MINSTRYDYIIAGSGCAGLSLLVHLVNSSAASGKRILIVDRERKLLNDRTWCFWEKGEGPFEKLVSQSWQELYFRSFTLARLFPLSPYKYKLIRSADFYAYCQQVISATPGVEQAVATVTNVGEDDKGAFIEIEDERIYGNYVFNSLVLKKPEMGRGEYYLLQHFKGWFIETGKPVFDPSQATMMDFRTSQEHGASFIYVMPFSSTSALVEYTLFSDSMLTNEQYEAGLKDYISQHIDSGHYHVKEEETGVIPMTNYRFGRGNGNIINIGTAGGQTRGSTGYTFMFIQKHSAAIVKALKEHKNPLIASSLRERRAAFYDSVLLNILAKKSLPAHEIFTRLFSRNDPRHVLRFLDKESSVIEDLKLVSTLPTIPFLKAAISQLMGK